MVSFIGVVDLGNEMQQQFDFTLERAELLRRVATNMVVQTLDRQRTVPLREALRDPDALHRAGGHGDRLARPARNRRLRPRTTKSWPTATPAAWARPSPATPTFAPLVTNTSWWEKLQDRCSRDKRYYQLEQPLADGRRRRCSTCGWWSTRR